MREIAIGSDASKREAGGAAVAVVVAVAAWANEASLAVARTTSDESPVAAALGGALPPVGTAFVAAAKLTPVCAQMKLSRIFVMVRKPVSKEIPTSGPSPSVVGGPTISRSIVVPTELPNRIAGPTAVAPTV